ncbi:hypothetical protein BsWGS_01108 [Bradybaena similaris]
MVPSDCEEADDSHVLNCNANSGNTNNTTVRFQDVVDFSDQKGQATKQECSKLVYSLSREVAVYCCLSMGVGGVSDSYVLRDELRCAASKVFDIVLLCKRRLMPLLLSKRLREEERDEVERLYRIFVGCLEMLQAEFIRAMTLQSMFPLWDSNTLLIQTGVSESAFHKKSCSILETGDGSGYERKIADHEEFTNLERKLTTLQEMCYTTSQMIDVNPWDFKPDADHTKIALETPDMERPDPQQARNRIHNAGNHCHRKCICIVVFVLVILVVIAGVVVLILAVTRDGHHKD